MMLPGEKFYGSSFILGSVNGDANSKLLRAVKPEEINIGKILMQRVTCDAGRFDNELILKQDWGLPQQQAGNVAGNGTLKFESNV